MSIAPSLTLPRVLRSQGRELGGGLAVSETKQWDVI